MPSKENTDTTGPSTEYIMKWVEKVVDKMQTQLKDVNDGHIALNAYVRNGLTQRITVATRVMVGVGIMLIGAIILHFLGVGT